MPNLTHTMTLSLNYEVKGEGNANDIILCNGAGLPLTFWGTFADKLAETCRVILFDQRNAGKTRFDGVFTLGDVAADMDALLDHLQSDRAIVIGHAWGGRLAQVFTRDYPYRVKGLVVCGTGGQFPAIDMGTTVKAMSQARKDGNKDEWQTHLETAYCAKGFSQRSSEQFQQLADAVWDAPPVRTARWNPHACPSDSYWGSAAVPTLLLYGEEDKNGTPENASDLHQRLVDSSLVMINEAGHFVVREQEDRVLTEINRFIQPLPAD